MPKYVIVGVYEDSHDRYATSVEAEDTDQAEALAQQQCREDNDLPDEVEPLIIAAVIEGDCQIVA